jgi:5-methylcytosine-specific restriction endonuclease McrA
MGPGLSDLVRRRARARCEYCHLPQEFSELRFHIEHIIPRQHGGSDDEENLALACPDCNLLKGPNLTGIDSLTRRVVRLFHPRRDRWREHFARRGPRISGRTPIGRVTVSLLRFNDPDRIEIRRLIFGL